MEFESSVTGDHTKLRQTGGLIDLLAVRMAYDLSLFESTTQWRGLTDPWRGNDKGVDPLTLRHAWLVAYENATRRTLAKKIAGVGRK